MYIPKPFEISEHGELAAIMHEHSFATIVTHDNGSLFASHVPVLFFPERGSRGVLAAHVARANSQWRHFRADQEILVIFQGPHGYISPNWYKTKPVVPTWNYVAVHAYGFPRLLENEEALEALLRAMVEKYESALPNPWPMDLPDDFKTQKMQAIVGFEIDITRLEGKFKLSQNRTSEDVATAIDVLKKSPNQADRDLAKLMAHEQPVQQLED